MNGRMAGYTDDRGSSGFFCPTASGNQRLCPLSSELWRTVYSDSDLALDKLFAASADLLLA